MYFVRMDKTVHNCEENKKLYENKRRPLLESFEQVFHAAMKTTQQTRLIK